MNILYFAGGGDVGGAKTHILSLGKVLARKHAFRLISFRAGDFAIEADQAGLQVDVMQRAWNIFGCRKLALKVMAAFQPTLIHCHGAKANLLGALVRGRRKIPVVTTVHSDPRRDYMGKPLRQALFGSLNIFCLRKMDAYLAVSDSIAESLIELGMDPQKIFVVRNGIDFFSAKEQSKTTRKEEIVIGLAARLTAVKDVPTLLRAFAKAQQKEPRLRLKIAGSGEEEEALHALASELGLAQQVDFVGWVSDMRAFYAGVDINVLSSRSEGMPYSLLEGALEHCPAIATAVGGIPELITHEENGLLFPVGDDAALADALCRLAADESLRKDLADRLYQKAKQEFSLEAMERRQMDAYAVALRRATQTAKRRGAVVCGAYGRGNAGDESILRAIVAQIHDMDPDMPVTVLSRDKADTRLKHRVDAIHIFAIPVFLCRLARARLFINGGGSLIQDVTSTRSLLYYLFTLRAAHLMRCGVIMYGCGIGPILRKRNVRLAARVLNRNVDVITLRDSNSIQVLHSWGVTRPVVHLAADPTVNFRPAPDTRILPLLHQLDIPEDRPKIAFCLRNWPAYTGSAAVAAAADHAYQVHGLLPVFLPIEIPQDVAAAEAVARHMLCPYRLVRERLTAEDLIGLLGRMQLLVGMRLHSLIFATLAETPVIGLSYDVKVESFIRDTGGASCIPVAEITVERLKAEIDALAAAGFPRAASARARLQQGEEVNSCSARELLENQA